MIPIGPVVLEEKVFMEINGQNNKKERKTQCGENSSLDPLSFFVFFASVAIRWVTGAFLR